MMDTDTDAGTAAQAKHADRPIGSSFESFLEEEGDLYEIDALAIKRIVDSRTERRNDRIRRGLMGAFDD